jgi:hypothetical protein
MLMKMLKVSTVLMGLALLGFAGCGSSDTTEGTPDAGGPQPFGISPGAYCYKITGVSAVNDGCDLGVSTLVGSALPGTYDATTGTFTLGTQGSLGGGVVTYNQGTLVRVKGAVSEPSIPGCSWNQQDTTLLTMSAENQFSASVTETQDTITAACGAAAATCTSTWTWTFAIDGTLTAPACK